MEDKLLVFGMNGEDICIEDECDRRHSTAKLEKAYEISD